MAIGKAIAGWVAPLVESARRNSIKSHGRGMWAERSVGRSHGLRPEVVCELNRNLV